MAEETVSSRCPRCGEAMEWAEAEAEGGPDQRVTFGLASSPLATGNLHRPFCSDRRWPFGQRCKLIDLGKWIDEEYRIASENPMPNEKEGGRGDDT
jgi:endogenous inhibitor of DNA gyrase (YacG/DUF329 family)